jgi:DNA uptake protein ComE-like DNA-binding protein
MKAFLTGLGIGVGLALVFAPERGEVTRGKVRERISEWPGTVSKQIERAKNMVAKQADRFHADTTANRGGRGKTRGDSEGAKPRKDGGHSSGDLINSISKDELLNVYGIGPVLADRIISGRPYSSRRELLERHVISQSTFEELERELGRRERRPA